MTRRTLFAAAMLLNVMVAAGAKENAAESVQGGIRISDTEIKKNGREVSLNLTIDLDGVELGTQQSLRLTPVIVGEEGGNELALRPVIVDGRTRDKVHRRQKALTGAAPTDDAYTVIRRKNGTRQTVDYASVVNYEPWMANSRLVLRQRTTGCLECGVAEFETAVKDTLVRLFKPQYITPFMQPQREPVKRRDVMRVARLQFRQDSRKIDPRFKNNQAELDTVTHSIAVVDTDPDMTITGIYITGWASPEGTVAYNKKLSQDRADALAAYAQKDTHVDPSLWHVVGMGEDWDGLREEVLKHPRLLKIDEVLKIIDDCDGDQDACEQKIRDLVPPDIYHRLLNEMYGPLRRNEYRIEYNVRNFNLDEARKQIVTRPELLSIEEMYAVADSYGKDSPEYADAILTAARVYPDKVAPVVNAACLELNRGDMKAAMRIIGESQVQDAPEALNALGVIYANDRQYDKALETLRRAAAAGSAEADANLEQLQRMLEDL